MGQRSRDARSVGRKYPYPPPQFTLTYKFIEVADERKAALVATLGLRELAERRARLEAASERDVRRDLGFASDVDCLDELDSDQPLRLLQINESGSGGMFGNWDDGPSKLHYALCSMGITEKPDGSGGSFGYGKAGFIHGSRIRAVVAYTCFLERTEDEYAEPEVTRRLLGSVYWGQHTLDGRTYEGNARLGNGFRPLDNDEADLLAKDLLLNVRNPDDEFDLGTSIVLVDPTVDPVDLQRAAERYWWPALEDKSLQFEIDIIDSNGTLYTPRPKLHRMGHDDLGAFISAYEVATNQDTTRDDHPNWDIKSDHALSEANTAGLAGRLCLTHNVSGWSYAPRQDDGVRDASLVALVRDPRMVVAYLDHAPYTWPYVRGTFVASTSVNDPLALTEPRGHDAWRKRSPTKGRTPSHFALARVIQDQIKKNIEELQDTLNPPIDATNAAQLPGLEQFNKLFLTGGLTPKPHVQLPRELSIQTRFETSREIQGRQVSGEIRVGYSKDSSATAHLPDEVMIRVSVRYAWEGLNTDSARVDAQVEVDPPEGYIKTGSQPETYEGLLRRDEPVDLYFMTEEYRQEWTGTLIPRAQVIDPNPGAL